MDSLFLVEKEDYKALIKRLVVEKIRTERIEEAEYTTFKVFGIESDDCICSCRWYNDEKRPEEYYIFKLPEKDEWTTAKPKLEVDLTEEETKMVWEELVKALKKEEK